MKKLIAVLTLLMGFCLIATAAEDPTGNWKATLDTPNGPMVLTFTFKLDEGKLTGTMGSEMMGNIPISAGKIEGDKISFSVEGQMGTVRVAGTLSGDTMKLTITVGDGQFTFDVNAARVKT